MTALTTEREGVTHGMRHFQAIEGILGPSTEYGEYSALKPI
jgi:hypothetical protein